MNTEVFVGKETFDFEENLEENPEEVEEDFGTLGEKEKNIKIYFDT